MNQSQILHLTCFSSNEIVFIAIMAEMGAGTMGWVLYLDSQFSVSFSNYADCVEIQLVSFPFP